MSRQTKHPFLIAVSMSGAACLLLALTLLLGDIRPAVALAEPPTAGLPPTPGVGGTPEPVAISAQQARPAAFPDLAIESLTLSPANPAPGQPATVTVVIKNIGTVALWDGFYAYLYVDPAQRPPTPSTPNTNYVGWFLGLGPGATFTWSYTDYTFETPGCDHVIYAWVDRDDSIWEENEQNNVARLDVCVGGGSAGDQYEPNNTCEQATTIQVTGTTQEHTFDPAGDYDWIKFAGVGGTRYRIAAQDIGTGSDVALEFQTRCNLPPSFGGSKVFETTLTADGPVYIRAKNQSSAATDAEYKISVTTLSDCSGYYEPNDTRATAGDISVGADAQRHSFCQSNDEDWVKFPVSAGNTYVVRATAIGAQAAPALLGYFGTGTPFSGNPLEFAAATDGTFYVRAANQPPTAHGPDTEYSLAVTTTGCQPDSFEPDNSRAAAKPVTVNMFPDLHNACPAGDRDWIKFTATAGITYTLETVGLGAMSDTILCLYDNIGTQIACDDDSGANRSARLTWRASSNGEYFTEIRQADATAAGPATEFEFSIVTGLCKPDLYEPDDTADTADPGPLRPDGSRQVRNFCATNDRDWVKLKVPAAGWYTIHTTDLAPGSDTVLTLHDTDRATVLAANDDFGPGTASQLEHQFSQPGTYYIVVRHFNPTRYGRSTTYFLSASPGRPTATATPGPGTPAPTPTATPTPPPSGIRTLILTNRAQLTSIYGAGRANPLLDKLAEFANHPAVQGEVIEVDGNSTVAAAYAAWRTKPTDVAAANQVTGALRGLALEYLAAHPTVQYIVLVGDDRVIPARRIKDRTDQPESNFPVASPDTTVGAALAQDYFLTDDYYADREPTPWEGAELYIPDWAIGRLVETPEEIISQIDAFLLSPEVTIGTATSKALVVGYDFVQDVAGKIAELLGQDLGNARVDATLIGDYWKGADFKEKQSNTTPAFKLQSINGHANYSLQGAPDNRPVTARDVIAGVGDLTGALIYSPGCHAGLNVPETVSLPLDLPQAFGQKRANYVANTGLGWGSHIGVKFSERLMLNYTQELLKGTSSLVGRALTTAKQRYYQEADGFAARDEKVLQQVTLYGFPMYRLNTPAMLSNDQPFPSATIISPFGGGAASTAGQGIVPATSTQAGSGPVRIQISSGGTSIAGVAGFQQVATDWGSYYRLDGHTNTPANGPLQPRIYANLIPPDGQTLRGAVFTSGAYITTTIDPVIDAAVNEYVPADQEPVFKADGFYPPLPFVLRGNDTLSASHATLAVVLGQYADATQLLYTDVRYDIYFSDSADRVGPTITWVDGYYNTLANQATFKVEATDPMTVTQVLISFTTGTGTWSSSNLTYNKGTHKWTGTVPRVRGAQYSVQAVDSAGNATTVTRKGGYFRLEDVGGLAEQRHRVYLPLVVK